MPSYREALATWNKKQQSRDAKYCFPKKGSMAYAAVKKIQLGTAYKHPYKTRG